MFLRTARVRPLADLALSRGAISTVQAQDFAVLCDHPSPRIRCSSARPIRSPASMETYGAAMFCGVDMIVSRRIAHGGHRGRPGHVACLPYLEVNSRPIATSGR